GNPDFESGYCSRVNMNEYDPMRGLTSNDVHYFYGAVSRPQSLFPQVGWYSLWVEGREFRTDSNQPSGVTLRQQLQTWQYRVIPAWWSSSSGPLPGFDPRVQNTDVIIDEGKMARKSFGYSTTENTNNVVDSWEYDYGSSVAPGPLIRRTHTDFLITYNNPEAGLYLRDLILNQTIYNGANNIVAQTQYGYDETSTVSAPGIVQNVSVGPQRGNLTHVSRWRNTDGAWLTATTNYDVAGNIASTQNPRGYTTSYTYTDCPGKYT